MTTTVPGPTSSPSSRSNTAMNPEVIVISSDNESVTEFPSPRTKKNPVEVLFETHDEFSNVPWRISRSTSQEDDNDIQPRHYEKTGAGKITGNSVYRGSSTTKRSNLLHQERYASDYLALLGDEEGIRKCVIEKRKEIDALIEKENNARIASQEAAARADKSTAELRKNEEEVDFYRISLATESSVAYAGRALGPVSKKFSVLDKKCSAVKVLRRKRDGERVLAQEYSKQAFGFEELGRRCMEQMTSLLIMLNAARSLEDGAVNRQAMPTTFASKENNTAPKLKDNRQPQVSRDTYKPEGRKRHTVTVHEDVIDGGNGAVLLGISKSRRKFKVTTTQRKIQKPVQRSRKRVCNEETSWVCEVVNPGIQPPIATTLVRSGKGFSLVCEKGELPPNNPYRIAYEKLGVVMISARLRNRVPRQDRKTTFLQDWNELNHECGRRGTKRRNIDLFGLISLVLRLGGIRAVILSCGIYYVNRQLKQSCNFKMKKFYASQLLLYEHKLVHGVTLRKHELQAMANLKAL